ncbi:hypothetical protein CC80DRAFT_545830 [Byssothecium circinans]|uniref:C3H1-type domain-containing protein n=1 Tax=Byssothecium circinans TaxID=147558 RepID=A0A6A5U3J4_9PLEO|nr:hypothetical protein CC80DRAFT_545830 [Byssothecium circinans]
MRLTRPPGPPPYTAEQIARLSSANERFRAEASLRSYICGHRLADEREGIPTNLAVATPGTNSPSNRGSLDKDADRQSNKPRIDIQDRRPGPVRHNGSGVPRRGSGGRGYTGHHPYPTTQRTRPKLCTNFTATGHCARPACPDLHDTEKLALCKHMLYNARCSAGDHCDLSHQPTLNNMPHCFYHLNGRCSKSPCAFAHVDIGLSSRVCEAFGTLGYCEKGAACTDLHFYECPEFTNEGSCPAGDNCKLRHVHRASRMRAGRSSSADNSPDGDGSPSGSYSDETNPPDDTHAFTQQDDYVALSSG